MIRLHERLHYWLRRFWGNERGVTAIEYAIVAPVFFIMLIMSIEVTFALLADATLERAASEITRAGKIGFTGSCTDAVKSMLTNRVSFWADTSNLSATVETVYHPDPLDVFAPSTDYQPACDAGGRGDAVVLQIGFDKPGLTGIFSLLGVQFFHYGRIVVIQNLP